MGSETSKLNSTSTIAAFVTNLNLYVFLRAEDLKDVGRLYHAIINEIPYEILLEDSNTIMGFARNFVSNLQKKWNDAYRNQKSFINKHTEWLESPIKWPRCESIVLEEIFNPSEPVDENINTPAMGPVSTKVPTPTATDKAANPTPQKNSPLWADSIFGVDVAVRELDVNQEVTPSFGRLPEIVDEVYSSIGGDDQSLNKQLTKGMLMYYSSALLWARLLDVKSKRGNTTLTTTEQEFCKSIMAHEYNVPQPIYLFLRGIGEVKDATGKTVYLANHNLPDVVVQGMGGYHANRIDMNSHNRFEEVPSLGICGDVVMAESSEAARPVPNFRVLPANTRATRNLCGYLGPIALPIRILLNSVGVSDNQFDETVTGTRLNIQLVQKISDYLASCGTFRNEKVKVDALTGEGDGTQLIKSKPTSENQDLAVKWTNLVIRPYSSNASPTSTFGATYLMGYQLYKEPIQESHANWCCVEAVAGSNWQIPAEWIENRNARRAVPGGFDTERFVSISDSQRNRTNAIVRRMITSPR